ncbi:PLP-dependent transferase [Xanthomonas fragariae]|nr:hypothetical protein BER92_05850 [Xanthomonas fragariae]AOD17727.1 hypothetical protein BER93_05855 [Xanthomonas fragariae]ENZ94491.1 O-succinylhomoserine (thiol)-lyase [Xanthomonas fragariae LMG 25863]MBL9198679.1 PLP-dependent transferase [Xanthomonas fragariae]MBL9220212.1 PLP-dependent transferase [Xanthomonas fragariae]
MACDRDGAPKCGAVSNAMANSPDIESLIAHPASMTHAAMPRDARAAARISDGLLRFSIGIVSIGIESAE